MEHEIGKILLHDFAFSPDVLVTLTRVDTTANLIDAKVYISVFFTSPTRLASRAKRELASGGGPEQKADEIIKMLNRNVFDIQQKINHTLRMRPVPKIKFVEETEISRAGRVEELLSQLK